MAEAKKSPYGTDPGRGNFAPDFIATDQLKAIEAALNAKVQAGTATTAEIESLRNIRSTRQH